MRILLLTFLFFSCKNGGKVLSPEEFNQKLKSTPDAVLLDVRTPDEYAEGYIEGAINIDVKNDDFEKEIERLDKNNSYFVYCKAGGRSAVAAKMMKKKGFNKVYDLKGGYTAWKKLDD